MLRLLEVLDGVVPEVVELVLDVWVVLEHGQESLGADLVDVTAEVRPSVLEVKAVIAVVIVLTLLEETITSTTLNCIIETPRIQSPL